MTIAGLYAALGGIPPSLGEIAAEYGHTRQDIFKKVKRLRLKGLVEDNDPERRTWGVRLSRGGKLLLETKLDAGLKT